MNRSTSAKHGLSPWLWILGGGIAAPLIGLAVGTLVGHMGAGMIFGMMMGSVIGFQGAAQGKGQRAHR